MLMLFHFYIIRLYITKIRSRHLFFDYLKKYLRDIAKLLYHILYCFFAYSCFHACTYILGLQFKCQREEKAKDNN